MQNLSTSQVHELRTIEFRKLFGDEFLLSVDRAAELLDVSVSTMNHWRSDGAGPKFVRLSGRGRGVIRYRMADLRAYTEEHVFSSTAEADMAMARVGVGPIQGFGDSHKFLAHTKYFLIDSLYADEATYVSFFRDPFLKVYSMWPSIALLKPWTRWERRESLIEMYLEGNTLERREVICQKLEAGYVQSLVQIPSMYWGGHPDLTMARIGK